MQLGLHHDDLRVAINLVLFIRFEKALVSIASLKVGLVSNFVEIVKALLLVLHLRLLLLLNRADVSLLGRDGGLHFADFTREQWLLRILDLELLW